MAIAVIVSPNVRAPAHSAPISAPNQINPALMVASRNVTAGPSHSTAAGSDAGLRPGDSATVPPPLSRPIPEGGRRSRLQR